MEIFNEILPIIEKSIPNLVIGMVVFSGFSVIVPIYMKILRTFIEGRNERLQRITDEQIAATKYFEFRSHENDYEKLDKIESLNPSDSLNKESGFRNNWLKTQKHYRNQISRLKYLNNELTQSIKNIQDVAHRNIDGTLKDDWRQPLIIASIRLSRESDRLKGKSTNNLILGIVFSTFSVAAIAILLFTSGEGSNDNSTFFSIIEYLPRFAIAAILQVVAIFFLKMHASIENDIKINKNEMTNIDLKLSSGLAACRQPELADIANNWSKEERNFVIKKDQKVASSLDLPELENFVDLISKIYKK